LSEGKLSSMMPLPRLRPGPQAQAGRGRRAICGQIARRV